MLTPDGHLIVYLDGRLLQQLLPKADVPDPDTARSRIELRQAREEIRTELWARRELARRRVDRLVRPARRPTCARRTRESRPRARRTRRTPRTSRAGPSDLDGDPEP